MFLDPLVAYAMVNMQVCVDYSREDKRTREFVRMVSHEKKLLRKEKQYILAFCLRNGFDYKDGNPWTEGHINYLKTVQTEDFLRETLDELLDSYSKIL